MSTGLASTGLAPRGLAQSRAACVVGSRFAGGRYLPPGTARGLPWGLELPCRDGEQLDASRARGRIREAMDGPLGPLVQAVAEALDLWWPVRSKVASAAELVVAGSGCGPQVVTIQEQISRIGRSPACQLRLEGKEIDREHCELRLEDGRLSVLDLGSTTGTVVNGYRLRPFEPRLLSDGDEISLAPFSIVVGACDLEPRQRPARLGLREPLWLEGEDPSALVGSLTDLWARLRAGAWEGYLRLPGSWTEHAYRSLDLPPPTGQVSDDELDRAIASFLLERIADTVARQSDQPISVGQVLPAESMRRRWVGASTWEGALFDLELAGQTRECAVLWRSGQEARRPVVERRWLAELPFAVSVVAGSLDLAFESLRQIGCGDIVLPDYWLAPGWVADPTARSTELGRVVAELQGLSRSAELDVVEGGQGYCLRWTEAWLQATKGDPMARERDEEESLPSAEAAALENAALETTPLGAAPPETTASENTAPENTAPENTALETPAPTPIRLPDELEVTVSFEIDRLHVTLEELSSWQAGGTVELARTPQDPVRILLHQGAATRVIGSGSVLVVDGRLGVQIDDWRVES